MSHPLRPILARRRNPDRPEPLPVEVETEPLRVAARRVAAAKPQGDTTVLFAAPERDAPEAPRLTLSAGDRVVLSSAIVGGDEKQRRHPLRFFALTVLFVLAAIGAVSVYHSIASAFLH
jgi:hypothetical protein